MNTEKRLEEIRILIKRNLKLKEGAKKMKEAAENGTKASEQARQLLSKIDGEIKDLRSEFHVLLAQVNVDFKPESEKSLTQLKEDKLKDSDLTIQHYRKQLDIETLVKEGISKLLQASKTASPTNTPDNEIFLLFQDSIVKTETLKMLILREIQKKHATLEGENTVGSRSSLMNSDGYEIPKLLNQTKEYLKNRIEVTQKLLSGAEGMRKQHGSQNDKKLYIQAQNLVEFTTQKLNLLNISLEKYQGKHSQDMSEDLKCLEGYSKNAVMSGTLTIILDGADSFDFSLFERYANPSQTGTLRMFRTINSLPDMQNYNITTIINIDSKPVITLSSRTPGPSCFGTCSHEILLLKNRELEIVVRHSESSNMIAYNSLTLLEFLDGEDHRLRIPLEPSGFIYCTIRYIVPRPRMAKIVRQKRIFAKSKGLVKDKTDIQNVDFETWSQIMKISKKRQSNSNQDAIQGSPGGVLPQIKSYSKTINPKTKFDTIFGNPAQTIEPQVDKSANNRTINIRNKISEEEFLKAPDLSRCFAINVVRRASKSKKLLCLNDFKLLNVLGQGHFGRVLLAEHVVTKEKVAIKSISKHSIVDHDDFDMISTERQILELATTQKNPFLVQLIACFCTDHHLCFIMEHVAGGDLMTHIHMEIFSESRTIFYSGCVVLGLQFLHNNGIIYRDLKLDNLMLDADGYVKIGDFGLCKTGMWHNVRTSTFCGTPEFIAPEILEASSYTRSVDWWELGVLIYEMLIGESPFPGEDENEIFESIIYRDPNYPPYLSAVAKNILIKLICKDPDHRLGSTVNDANDVKDHPFYSSLDFGKLYERKIIPEFVPKFKKGACTFIDEEFLNVKPDMGEPEGNLDNMTPENKAFFDEFYFVATVLLV